MCRLLLLPQRSTLFPYTTLFRSECRHWRRRIAGRARRAEWQSDSRAERHVLSRTGDEYERDVHSGSEEDTSELQSQMSLVCCLLVEKRRRQSSLDPRYEHSQSDL